ncbi:MAG: hypothetical protein QM811_22710 [Pirellulales bacterium]
MANAVNGTATQYAPNGKSNPIAKPNVNTQQTLSSWIAKLIAMPRTITPGRS